MAEDLLSSTNRLVVSHNNHHHHLSSSPQHQHHQQQQHYSAIMHTYANPFQTCNISSSGGGYSTEDTTGPIIPSDLNTMRPSQLLKNSFAGSGPAPASLQSNHSGGVDHHDNHNSLVSSSSYVIQRLLSYFRAEHKQQPPNDDDDDDDNDNINLRNRCCCGTDSSSSSSWLRSFSTITLIILIFILIIVIIFLTALHKENITDNTTATTFRMKPQNIGDINRVPCVVIDDMDHQQQHSTSHLPTVTSNQYGSQHFNHDHDLFVSNCPRYFPRDSSQYKEINLFHNQNRPPHTMSISSSPSPSMPISLRLTPFSSWSIWFNQIESSSLHINFQFYAPIHTRLALVANKNEPPSLTMHQIFQVISDDEDTLLVEDSISNSNHIKRDSQLAMMQFEHKFDQGSWYLSLINDFDIIIPLVVNISIIQNQTLQQQPQAINCMNNCNNHGYCSGDGRCHCFPGFIGTDCSDNVCPIFCNGHGQYLQGSCHCESGWKGRECTLRSNECEIADCNGNGLCIDGSCHCRPGFKGNDCEQVDCIDPECSGHGICMDGNCFCKAGFAGTNCSEMDRKLYKFLPNCSGHGVYDFENDLCICHNHYSGSDCSKLSCSLNCGQNGLCHEGRCHCNDGWYGSNCQYKKCDIRCLEHGKCYNGTCHCQNGWMGKHCTLNGCPNTCSKHGQCVPIATANNRDDFDVVDDDHNDSDDNAIEWRCKCDSGWHGYDCSAPQETNCNDEIDNDNDGLVDCADSECCHHEQCGHQSLMCITSPDPLDILLRKQPPSPTSSFFQKVLFLIEDGSVQSYAQKDVYSPKRAAVIRGQVVSKEFNGLIGIRVSVVNDLKYGFTLTRSDGWFDILVNGGGIITLQFQRNPFYPIKKSIYVEWNDITVIQNPIVMYLGPSQSPSHSSSTTINNDQHHHHHGNEFRGFSFNSRIPFVFHNLFSHSDFGESNWRKWITRRGFYNESKPSDSDSSSTSQSYRCLEHHYEHMRPMIRDHHDLFQSSKFFPTPNNEPICDKDNCIIAEMQTVHEKIRIGTTRLFVVYQSSQSSGYSSTMDIQLTTDNVPKSLRFLLLRILIEGNIHEKIFESDSNIRYTFTWNKQNVYKQKVYGFAQAKIYVGYYYHDCPHILWTAFTTKLLGYVMEISEIGQWNLEIHNRYNPYDGHFQRGDGQFLSFKNNPRLPLVIEPVAGLDSHPRSFACLNPSECNTDIGSSRFFSLVTMTNSADGSVFVGDSNLIRRITPDGQIYTVYKLRTSTNRQNFEYHIAYNSIDQYLYIADPERFQIIRVPIQEKYEPNQEITMPEAEIVVGTGEQCFPHDQSSCDDGKTGVEVQLIYPKDLAFANDGSLFFSDGNVIRILDTNGYVRRVVGQFAKRQWKPISCQSMHSSDHIKLKWPTSLAIHPLDGSLFFVDNHVLFKLNQNMQVSILSGYSSFCLEDSDTIGHNKNNDTIDCDGPSLNAQTMSLCGDEFLFGSIAFAPNGVLYVADISRRNENRIFAYMHDGSLRHVAGFRQKKSRHQVQCPVEKCIDMAGENCTCLITDYESNDDSTIEPKIALKARLNSISAITITGDGTVYLADEGQLRLYSMKSYLPQMDDQNEIKILFPNTAEMYVFNKYGQHIRTRSITTGRTLYSFVYNHENSLGKLTQVIDSSGHKILFIRDQTGSLHMIESTSNALKCRITINKQGLLESFMNGGNISVNFDYYNNGLIRSREESLTGKSYFYRYDRNGRIRHFIQPNGALINIYSSSIDHDQHHHLTAIEMPLFIMTKYHHQQQQQQQKQQQQQTTSSSNNFDKQHFLPIGQQQITDLIIGDNSMMIKFSQHGTMFELTSLNDGSLRLNTSRQIYAHLNGKISKLSMDMLAIQAQLFPFISKFTLAQMNHGRDQQLQTSLDMEIDYNLRLKSSFIDSVEKLIKINDNLTMKIEYDWNANREIYYNQSQRPILFLQYDDYGRPIQWIPNIKEHWQAHSVTYDKLGKLDTWQNGQHTQHYQRDRVGRLTELRQNDHQIRYSYPSSSMDMTTTDQLNNPGFSLPSSIILKSGHKYIVDLDNVGRIQSIITPKGARHNVSINVVLGAYRFSYCPPPPSTQIADINTNIHISPSRHCFHIYLDEKWQSLMRILPYDMGKIIHHYKSKISFTKDQAKDFLRLNQENNNNNNNNNNIITIDRMIHGRGLIERWYDEKNQRTVRGIWINNQMEFAIQYKYSRSSSSLLKHQSYLFSSNIHSSIAQFSYSYRYDNQMRLRSIQSKLGSITLPNCDFTYDSKGQIESIGNFRYFEHSYNETLIGDGIALLVRRYDPIKQRRIRHNSLTVSDKEVFRSDFIYDANGLLIQTRTFMHHLGANKLRIQNYTYDMDGQLIEMQGREHWRFVYDPNGNLITFLYMGNRVDIEYDWADRIRNFIKSQHNSAITGGGGGGVAGGTTPYVSDLRGFITQRGDEYLYYNNLGQLLQAITPNRYEVNYAYDYLGRLILRRDHQKNVTQYFYGNPSKPYLVTHAFNNANGAVLSLIYDDIDDSLIMIRLNNENFYVVCDQTQTPSLIFDHRGQVVKEIHRSPYGYVLFDSNPNLFVPVDFYGGIADPLTNLIHFNGHQQQQQRLYDTLIGRWLTPNVDQLLEKNLIKFPRFVNMYQFKQNDPINNNNNNNDQYRYSGLKDWNNHGGGVEIMSLSQIQTSLLQYTSSLVNQDIGHQPQFDNNNNPILLTQFTSMFENIHIPNLKSSTISSLQTLLLDQVQKFSTFQSNYYSKQLTQNDWTDEQNGRELITMKNALFGQGIVLSLMIKPNAISAVAGHQSTDILCVHFSHSITDNLLRESLNILVNGSHLLDINLIMAGQDHYYLVKDLADNDNLRPLMAKFKQYQSRLNLTVQEIHHNDDKRMMIEVRIYQPSVIWNIRFGTTVAEERERVLMMARKYAIQQRIEHERIQIVHHHHHHGNGNGGYSQWNEQEKQFLMNVRNEENLLYNSIGLLRADYQYSLNELAEDPDNIVLKKRSAKS
ncbi:Teneurin-2 [Dermatophagoides farinae]|uniref:Teneurin-2 n=1 Tax=Dermatophagoides farinae TaxID=6954 RepID=A0A922L4C6_DERFA|nr:Teneurin-2 [Dermatophagoides farinae]